MPTETREEKIARLRREAEEDLEEARQLEEYFRLKSMTPHELDAEARTIAAETGADHQAPLDRLKLGIAKPNSMFHLHRARREMFLILGGACIQHLHRRKMRVLRFHYRWRVRT